MKNLQFRERVKYTERFKVGTTEHWMKVIKDYFLHELTSVELVRITKRYSSGKQTVAWGVEEARCSYTSLAGAIYIAKHLDRANHGCKACKI